jgi:hypothetical protein
MKANDIKQVAMTIFPGNVVDSYYMKYILLGIVYLFHYPFFGIILTYCRDDGDDVLGEYAGVDGDDDGQLMRYS